MARRILFCSSVCFALLPVQLNALTNTRIPSDDHCALKVVYDTVNHEGHVCSPEEVRARARKGSPFEQNQIGIASLLQTSGVDSSQEALHWFEEAAKRGYAPAQVNLGLMYFQGWETEKNYALAMHYFHLAADQGEPAGYFNLGLHFLRGVGVRQDYAEAMRLFLKSAAKNNPPAQAAIGMMYDQGMGVDRNAETAAEWYRKAAEGGHPEAQKNLGDMYFHGVGVPKDEISAFRWFHEAAMRGDIQAQVNLGYMCAKGWGTLKDIESAYMWLTAASMSGYNGAKSITDSIERELTRDQLTRAREQAAQLQPQKQGLLVLAGIAP